MCDPVSENELTEVKVDHALLKGRTDITTDSHSVTSCHGLQKIPFCKDSDHRKLAICSIVCGLSCLGIMSLIYSVKARETRKALQNEDKLNRQKNLKVKEYSKKAFRWALCSIVAWVCLIIILPFVLGLLSYILTFID